MFFISAFDVLQPSVNFDVSFFFQPLINFVHVFHEPFVHLFNVHTISKYSILITDFSLCFSLSISASDKQCFACFYSIEQRNPIIWFRLSVLLKNLALVSGFQILGQMSTLTLACSIFLLAEMRICSLFTLSIYCFSSGDCKCNHRNNLVY